jgi:membrane carboxypeptidase/penicillin-binding protein
VQKSWKKILTKLMSYKINSILSNEKDRPASRNNFLTISLRKIAVKTWTSTKQYQKNGQKIVVAKNLWTIWYTPQITTVVWVWNTSWEELWKNAYWLTWAWPIMRDYMEFAHKGLEIQWWEFPE